MEDSCSSVEGGLWGCIVVISAFFIQVMTFGTSQCIGVYNIELLRYFDAGAAAVSFVGSINYGVFLGAGPLASILMARWSHRQVAVFGAILCNVGLICLPFSPNLEYMYVFYGVIVGLGYCLVYIPSHVLSGLYFHKHRSLATAIPTAGSGLGSAIFPIILYIIIEYYGWRGSLFIVAGLNLHLLVFAALLRPVPEQLKRRFAEAEELQNMAKIPGKAGVKNEKDVKSCQFDYNFNGPKGNNRSDMRKEDQIETEKLIGNNISDTRTDDQIETEMLMIVREIKPAASTSSRLKKHFTSVFTLDFFIFWVSNICWNAGTAIVLIFFPEYAYSLGLSKENASIAYAMAGVGAGVGGVLGGFLGNVKYFNRIGVYMLGNFGAGAVTLLLPWQPVQTFGGLLSISLVFGLYFGVIWGLLVVVTADLLGTEALGDGFGYLMLANGIGIFIGPPIAGLMMDIYGSQDPSMFFSGAVTAAGGLVMIPVYLRQRVWHISPETEEIEIVVKIQH